MKNILHFSLFFCHSNRMDSLLALLTSLSVPFTRYDHPAVFTCEESERLCPPMIGAHTKQLLMKAKGKEIYVLAIVMHEKKCSESRLALSRHSV